MAALAKLIVLACFLSFAMIQTPKAVGMIVTYWGQNESEGSLADACNTGLYSIINIAFVNQFGGGTTLGLNLTGHCDQASNNCTKFGEEIKACQNLGIKIFISLGGPDPRLPNGYSLESEEDAKRVADQIWNSFLGGTTNSSTTSPRPFGDEAVLDGVDFSIQWGLPLDYTYLAAYLKEYNTTENPVYLSGAAECEFPGGLYMSNVIYSGYFDFIWIKFYDNPSCEYSDDKYGYQRFLTSWKVWDWKFEGSAKLFLGLPAAPNASNSGYIFPELVNYEIIPLLKNYSKYGGVMLWSRYWDSTTHYSSKLVNELYNSNNLIKSAVSI